MSILKVIFSQSIESSKIDHPSIIERKAITEDKKSEEFLRLWASHELFKWFQMTKAFGLRTFHLRPKIKVDVYWDENLENSYVQKRFTKDLIFDEKSEFKIKIYDGIYILKSFIENHQPKHKVKLIIRSNISANYSSLINSVEYKKIEKVKFASPILYTGMTN